MKRTIQLLAALVLWPAAVFADEPPAEIRYDFVDVGLTFGEVDTIGNDVDFSGFNVGGSWGFHENIALFARLGVGEIDVLDDVDTTELSVGITPHFALTDSIDLVIPVAIEWVDLDSGLFSDDDTGYSIGIGIRALLNPSWELGVGVQHVDIFDDDEQSLAGNVRWHLTHLFSLGLGAQVSDDTSGVLFDARFSF